MATNVYDLTDLAVLNRTVRQLQFPQLALNRWLPDTNVQDTEYRILQNVRTQLPAAEFRSWDTESPIGKRRGLTAKTGQIPPISQKVPLSEYERIKLNQLTSALGPDMVDTIYGDAAEQTKAIKQRLELAKGEALSLGTVTIAGNGLALSIDYGIPAGHKVAPAGALWSDIAASTPVQDLMLWRDVYVATNGFPPDVLLTSSRVLGYLQRNAEIRALAASPGLSFNIIGVPTINSVLGANLLPPIAVYDARYANGAGTMTRAIADDRVLMLPAGSVTSGQEFARPGQISETIGGVESVRLGETKYGITVEAMELGSNPNPTTGASAILDTSDMAGVTITTLKDGDPVQIWTKASAVAFPVLEEPAAVLTADVA